MPTVEIPGGTAELVEPSALTPRRKRPIELLSARLGRIMEPAMQAARVFVEGDLMDDRSEQLKDDGTPAFTGADVHLSESQLALMMRLNDAIAWAILKSWTLPDPLPETPDALLDIDPGVFDVLRVESAKLAAGEPADVFTVDALPADPDAELDGSLPTSA